MRWDGCLLEARGAEREGGTSAAAKGQEQAWSGGQRGAVVVPSKLYSKVDPLCIQNSGTLASVIVLMQLRLPLCTLTHASTFSSPPTTFVCHRDPGESSSTRGCHALPQTTHPRSCAVCQRGCRQRRLSRGGGAPRDTRVVRTWPRRPSGSGGVTPGRAGEQLGGGNGGGRCTHGGGGSGGNSSGGDFSGGRDGTVVLTTLGAVSTRHHGGGCRGVGTHIVPTPGRGARIELVNAVPFGWQTAGDRPAGLSVPPTVVPPPFVVSAPSHNKS